jgi:hypothetical protein
LPRTYRRCASTASYGDQHLTTGEGATTLDRLVLLEFLRRQRYGVIASIAADGSPQSALVGIATTGRLEIVFDTLDTTRKYANLIARPRCSLVIGWTGEQTMQIDGDAKVPEGEELERYRALYFETWPDGRERLSWPGIAHVVVTPRWIRFSDFAQQPPLIEEEWI